MTTKEFAAYQLRAADMLAQAGIVLIEDEVSDIEVTNFALGNFE